MRPLASQLAEDANLTIHRSRYDANNQRVNADLPEVQNLIPPIRKHTYAPDVHPSELISEEAIFQALTRIDWTSTDLQPQGEEEAEPAPNDLSTLQHRGIET